MNDLLIKVVGSEGGRKALVYFDREWEEYYVDFYIKGKAVSDDSRYHTDTRSDAIGTAEHWVSQEVSK